MSFESIGKGIVKRKKKRILGLFIDGTGLDRATRRINRKVDMPKLVRGVTSGTIPAVARYYTLIPYEDDSRQHAFLDAIRRAGIRVIVKRLPPKGITRQVTVDVEMAADIVSFAQGHSHFSDLSEYGGSTEPQAEKEHSSPTIPLGIRPRGKATSEATPKENEQKLIEQPDLIKDEDGERIVTVVCPSRELSYPLSLVGELGIDTVTADFGQFNNKDVLKSAAKWIDLSDSETIWRG